MKPLIALIIILVNSCTLQAFSVLGELTKYYTVSPGEMIAGTLTLQNGTESLESFRVVRRDYTFSASGETSYLEPGTVDRSCAGWIKDLRPGSGKIPPGEQVEIYFAIQAPEDLPEAGTYWSTLVVEPIRIPDQDANDDADVRISTKIRYAVQIVVDVGPKPSPILHFEKPSIVKNEKETMLMIDLANSGKIWFNPVARMEVYDESGSMLLEQRYGNRRTFPGTQVRYKLDASSLGPGNYKVIIILETEDDAIAGIYKFIIE